MMLITLNILLPLVHTVAGMECHAMPKKTVNASTLPEPIVEQLEKGGIIWNNQTSLATYYRGFPHSLQRDNQFIAVCITGSENPAFRTCVNATHINGGKGIRNITLEDFNKFYQECNNDIFPNFGKPEEEEDDHDTGKNAFELEHQELGEAAGVVN